MEGDEEEAGWEVTLALTVLSLSSTFPATAAFSLSSSLSPSSRPLFLLLLGLPGEPSTAPGGIAGSAMMPPCGKNMCGYSRPWDMPGIRKGLKVRWLPVPPPRCAAPMWALLVEVMMAAASATPALLLASVAPFSSRLLSFSPPPEPEEAVLSLSAGVVEEGLAASDVDGAVVVVTFAADNEEEEEELG